MITGVMEVSISLPADRRTGRDLRRSRLRPRLVGTGQKTLDILPQRMTMSHFRGVADARVAELSGQPAQPLARLGAHLRAGIAIRGQLHQARRREAARGTGDRAAGPALAPGDDAE